MGAELQVQLAVGEGPEKGKLRMQMSGPGGCDYALALPWQLALWLGRALRDPDVWLQLKPCDDAALRIDIGDDAERTVTVSAKGRRWFAIASTQVTLTSGKANVLTPARELGAYIMAHAKRVAELEDAPRVIADTALLLNRGVPHVLTHDRAMLREAKKEAQFDHDLRKGAGGLALLNSLNGKAIYGPPTAMQFAPGTSQHDQNMARITAGSMSKQERDALRKQLEAEENAQ